MGDRCYLQITVRKEDEKAFLSVVGRNAADEREENDLNVTLTFEQANYGFGNDLDEFASLGFEFYGWHGQGSSYDSAEFFSHDNKARWIYTGCDGGYVIDGRTPQERRNSLRRLELLVKQQEAIRMKIDNPLCALALAMEGQTNE